MPPRTKVVQYNLAIDNQLELSSNIPLQLRMPRVCLKKMLSRCFVVASRVMLSFFALALQLFVFVLCSLCTLSFCTLFILYSVHFVQFHIPLSSDFVADANNIV
jgi:hypothetical protein